MHKRTHVFLSLCQCVYVYERISGYSHKRQTPLPCPLKPFKVICVTSILSIVDQFYWRNPPCTAMREQKFLLSSFSTPCFVLHIYIIRTSTPLVVFFEPFPHTPYSLFSRGQSSTTSIGLTFSIYFPALWYFHQFLVSNIRPKLRGNLPVIPSSIDMHRKNTAHAQRHFKKLHLSQS